MDGKSWLTGQNWIDQFIGNCARAGNTDVIGQITDYNCVHRLILDTDSSFPSDTAFPWEIITDSMNWRETEQGWGAWNERHIEFRHQQLGQNRLLR